MSRKYDGHLTLRLEPGEACVVLEKKFWDHMIKWYTIMAEETQNPVERSDWYSIINAVNTWVDDTYLDPTKVTAAIIEDNYDDDEWN